MCGVVLVMASGCGPEPLPSSPAPLHSSAPEQLPSQPEEKAPASLSGDVPTTSEELLDRFVGDWIVVESSPNTMHEQVNVWIRREDGRLAIFEGGMRELDLRIASEDTGTGEISLIERLPDSEIALNVKPLKKATISDSAKPDIVMEWGDGTRWVLSGGEVSSRSDHYTNEAIVSMREGGRRLAYRVESGFHCYGEISLRYRILCKNEALSSMHLDLMSKFMSISGEYPDSHRTYQAAIRSLDACKNRKCLEQQYAEWGRYLDENYEGLQLVD